LEVQKVSPNPKPGNAPQSAAYPKLHAIRLLVDRITMALNVIGTLLIVAIMVLINADVIGRSGFNLPISGVPEMVSMSIVAIVFLQVAQAFRMGRLTRSEAILGVIEGKSARLRAAIELVFCAGTLTIMAQLLASSWPLFLKSWTRNTFEGTIGDFTAPIWPVKLIILIGCTALIIQLFIAALVAFHKILHGETGDPEIEISGVQK
jgi:TRAP-type mannitol/chloroaromatic compound transport system permease small subunit